MKKAILFLFVLLPVFLFGQLKSSDRFGVSTGKPYPVVDAPTKLYFADGDDVDMVKLNRKNTILQRYSVNSKKELSRKVLHSITKEYYVLDIVKLNGRFSMFKLKENPSTKKETLSVSDVLFRTGKFGSDKVLLTSIDRENGIRIDYSYDSSMFMVSYRNPPKYKSDKKNYDVITMAVFDNNMEKMWSKDVKMPYTEAVMNNIDYCVDGQGIAYITIKKKKSANASRESNRRVDYDIEVLKVDEGVLSKIKIDDRGVNINEIRLLEGPNNNLFLVGYFNDVKKNNNFNNSTGVFMASFSSDGETSNLQTYDIPEKLIKMYKTSKEQRHDDRKKKKKGKQEFESLKLRNVSVDENGEAMIIGEQYFVIANTYTSNGVSHTTYTYYYQDILVTKIEGDGTLKWMKKLPKRQVSAAPTALGFKYIERNGNHYFFYMDNIKNVDLPEGKRPEYYNGRGGVLTAYTISDDDGSVSKDFIADITKIKISGIKGPKPVYQFSTNRILETESGVAIEVYKKKKQDVMLEVTFKDEDD